MVVTVYILTALAAYLLGSIPTGYLVAKARGIDIRTVGSGNIGATNVFRILGKPAGIFVLLVDAAKGFVGAAFAGVIVTAAVSSLAPAPAVDPDWLKIVGGMFAILGHNYTCWLRFKGGKGIATSAGAILALFPVAFGIALATWIVLLLFTRYVSVASIGAAAILPFAAWWAERGKPAPSMRMIVVAAVIGALAIYKHRANIQRLLNGTENRFGKKKVAG